MSKYFDKLAEEESSLRLNEEKLEKLESDCERLFQELCKIGSKKYDTSMESNDLKVDLELIKSGYKKILSDDFYKAKANWGFYLFELILIIVASLLITLVFKLPVFISIVFPTTLILVNNMVSFFNENKQYLEKLKKLRKETTAEQIETDIRDKELEIESQKKLYDAKSIEYKNTMQERDIFKQVVSKEKLRVKNLREKCMLGYNLALKELLDNMTPEQKAEYESAIDLNIASQMETDNVDNQEIGDRVLE